MLDSPTDCKPSPTMERSIPVSLVKFMVSAPKTIPVGAPINDKKNVMGKICKLWTDLCKS